MGQLHKTCLVSHVRARRIDVLNMHFPIMVGLKKKKKKVTYAKKSHQKLVNPRDIAENADDDEEEDARPKPTLRLVSSSRSSNGNSSLLDEGDSTS